jgi:hypothetical protein
VFRIRNFSNPRVILMSLNAAQRVVMPGKQNAGPAPAVIVAIATAAAAIAAATLHVRCFPQLARTVVKPPRFLLNPAMANRSIAATAIAT